MESNNAEVKPESLDNTKLSARQQHMYEGP